MDKMDKMDVLYLVTDYLCKKKIEEEDKLDYFQPQYALAIVSVFSVFTLSYNFYSYFKLKRNYEELKKKAGFDQVIKNVYNDLVNITESDSDSDSDSEEEEDVDDEEYGMQDIDLKK